MLHAGSRTAGETQALYLSIHTRFDTPCLFSRHRSLSDALLIGYSQIVGYGQNPPAGNGWVIIIIPS